MATFAKIRELYSGIFWGIVLATLIILFVNPIYKECIDMIRALPQLTTCIFGFLLTLLGIILQGDGPIIKKMQNSTVIYNRFIAFNKKIVVLSFAVTVLALIMGYVNYDWLKSLLSSMHPLLPMYVRKVSVFLLSFGSVWLVIDLVTFIKLFYMLIKKSK